MDNDTKEILLELLQMECPSGSEEQVIDLFGNSVSSFVDEVTVDVNGNSIAHRKGNGKKVILMAHADEVGLLIHYIDDRGFLYFKELGCIDTNLLPGQRVAISGKKGIITGIIGKRPIHLQDKADGSKELMPEDLWIDIAAKDKVDAMSKVKLGAVASYISKPLIMSDTIIASKSLDDRIGIAILIGVAKNLQKKKSDYDIYFVASAQEELGARGAQTVTESIMPEIGIAIDVTHATDYPTTSPVKYGDISLGKGVVISLGPNINKTLRQSFIDIADTNRIQYQIEVLAKPTGTDAKMIQVAGKGVLTGLLCIPCRYMHTPNEIVSLTDADNAITLLSEYLQN
jgi:endoglucanase